MILFLEKGVGDASHSIYRQVEVKVRWHLMQGTIVLLLELQLYNVLVPWGFVVTLEAQKQHVVRTVRLKCVREVCSIQSGHDVEPREVVFAPARYTLILTISGVVLIINPVFITGLSATRRLKI